MSLPASRGVRRPSRARTPIEPSVDDIPQSTRSGAALLMAAARIVLVPMASVPCTASSLMWMPADGPICSARLIASAASSGPSVMATTSTSSPSSAIRSACSSRVLVELGQQTVGGGPVDRPVGGEAPFTGGVGHVLDQDDDLHSLTISRVDPSALRAELSLYYWPVTCSTMACGGRRGRRRERPYSGPGGSLRRRHPLARVPARIHRRRRTLGSWTSRSNIG